MLLCHKIMRQARYCQLLSATARFMSDKCKKNDTEEKDKSNPTSKCKADKTSAAPKCPSKKSLTELKSEAGDEAKDKNNAASKCNQQNKNNADKSEPGDEAKDKNNAASKCNQQNKNNADKSEPDAYTKCIENLKKGSKDKKPDTKDVKIAGGSKCKGRAAAKEASCCPKKTKKITLSCGVPKESQLKCKVSKNLQSIQGGNPCCPCPPKPTPPCSSNEQADRWRKISLYGVLPLVALLALLIFSTHKEPERPEFVNYPHMYRRTKPYWFGSGNRTAFHNKHWNALPPYGYEDEIDEEGIGKDPETEQQKKERLKEFKSVHKKWEKTNKQREAEAKKQALAAEKEAKRAQAAAEKEEKRAQAEAEKAEKKLRAEAEKEEKRLRAEAEKEEKRLNAEAEKERKRHEAEAKKASQIEYIGDLKEDEN